MNEQEMFNKIKSKQKLLPFVVVGFVLIILLFKSITIVPAGHVGVKDLFGNVSDNSLKAGIHLVWIQPRLQRSINLLGRTIET